MDPITFQLLLAGLGTGVQALMAFAQNKDQMTPEQKAQCQIYVDRITAAQNSVTPYMKEPSVNG